MNKEPSSKYACAIMNKASTEGSGDERLFDELSLTKEERKFVRISDDSIFFGFPFSIGRIFIGGKETSFDGKLKYDFYEHVINFFETLLYEKGFRDVLLFTTSTACRDNVEFYKEFNSDEEAVELIRWLLSKKMRLGI